MVEKIVIVGAGQAAAQAVDTLRGSDLILHAGDVGAATPWAESPRRR